MDWQTGFRNLTPNWVDLVIALTIAIPAIVIVAAGRVARAVDRRAK